MIAVILPLALLSSTLLAHATVSPPNGSWLGTQTVTDNFQLSCNGGGTDSSLGTAYSTTPGDQSVQNGEFTAGPTCYTDASSDPIQYFDIPGGVGGYLSLVGSGQTAANGGTITASTLDCGQEGGSCSSPPSSCTTGCFSFYIPNYGQSYTPVDMTTDAYVDGGIGVSTNGDCIGSGNPYQPYCGDAQAQASLQLSVIIQAVGTITTWTIPLISDSISCTSNSSNSWNVCSNSVNYDDKEYLTAPQTFNLPSGYEYTATLQATIGVSDSLSCTGDCFNTGGGTSDYACFYYNSNCTSGSSTTCAQFSYVPSYNGKCQFIFWNWLKLTSHDPDFSVSTPGSMSVNAGSSTNANLNINSFQVGGSNSYSLTTPVTLSATSNDPKLGFSFSQNPVTPPAGGTVPSTLTVSESNACDPSGSYTITLTGTVNDSGGKTSAQSHSYNIPISVTGGCDFTVSANPSSFSLAQYECYPVNISVNSVGGFSGTVTLSYSSSIAASFNGCWGASGSTTVTVPSQGSAIATLTFNACAPPAPGTYSVTVTASSSSPSINHPASISVTIIAYSSSCLGGGGCAPAPVQASTKRAPDGPHPC